MLKLELCLLFLQFQALLEERTVKGERLILASFSADIEAKLNTLEHAI